MGETAPMTSLNFVSLARGHKQGKKTLSYAKSPIHRIVPDFVLQMGDITEGDGTGGKSILAKNSTMKNSPSLTAATAGFPWQTP